MIAGKFQALKFSCKSFISSFSATNLIFSLRDRSTIQAKVIRAIRRLTVADLLFGFYLWR